MPAKTIHVEFTRDELPNWAQKHDEVFWLCESNLAFRCDVYSADTAQYKRFLIRKARRLYPEITDY